MNIISDPTRKAAHALLDILAHSPTCNHGNSFAPGAATAALSGSDFNNSLIKPKVDPADKFDVARDCCNQCWYSYRVRLRDAAAALEQRLAVK